MLWRAAAADRDRNLIDRDDLLLVAVSGVEEVAAAEESTGTTLCSPRLQGVVVGVECKECDRCANALD